MLTKALQYFSLFLIIILVFNMLLQSVCVWEGKSVFHSKADRSNGPCIGREAAGY